MAPLRLIFMGTPDFSVPVLDQLIKAGHQIVCVYSQPPRPAGRGQKQRPSPVHAFAEARGLLVRTPKNLKSEHDLTEFADLNADVAVVVAYGLILPKPALLAPKMGCINIHASLLPRWRGAAPIQRAIMAGDQKSGVTIMQMNEGLDTGDILSVIETELEPEITAPVLHDRLSATGAELIVKTLEDVSGGKIKPISQPDEGVTYAKKLDKTEGRIDWRRSATELDRLVRAFTPWPGVWFEYEGERIKVFKLALSEIVTDKPCGTVLDAHLRIACADGAVQLLELQRPGKKRASAEDFIRGYKIEPGTCLGD